MNGLVKCFALIVMLGFIPISYASSNANTLLPEIKALALDKLVLDRTDKPVTVLETPVITDASGKVAQGLTKVKVSLAVDAASSLIIQGKSLKPGQSMTIVLDLTVTGGVLKIPFYPETSNIAGISHYSLDIPNITAEICPDSYSLNSATNTCQKVNTTSLLYTCPGDNWTYSGDLSRCIKQTEIPKSTCPVGFDSNGDGTCTKTEYEDTVAKCSAGYAYSAPNDRCEKTLEVIADKTCSDPSYTYISATNDCRKTITQSVNYDCLSGFSYNSTLKICERTLSTTGTPTCTTGYSYSTTNKRCEKTLTQTASKVCASGYTYSSSNNRCEKALTAAENPICTTGYSYSAARSRCEKTVTQTASKVCSSGYSYSAANNRCEKITIKSAKPVCSSSYTYSSANSRCEKTAVQAASKVCASGYTYSSSNNRCEKTLSQTASRTCITGTYQSDTNTCRTSSKISVPLTCDGGAEFSYDYEFEHWYCGGSGYDSGNYTCPAGSEYAGFSDSLSVGPMGYCRQYTTSSAAYTCPDLYSLSGSTCYKLQAQAYSYSCPSNYTLSGSSCSRLLTGSNTWSCDSGWSLSGSTCSLLQTQGFSYNCPTNYTLSGSSCSRLLTASNTWSCNSGWSLSGSTCYSTSAAAYTYTCPVGYVNHNNGSCTQLQTQANTWTCPTNYTNHNNGSCSWYQTAAYSLSCSDSSYSPNSSTEICNKVLTNAHIYKCNDPSYTLSGSNCSLLLTEQEEWICGDTSFGKISETQCLKETDTNLVATCPIGFVESSDGKSCEYSDATPLVDSCPASFALKGGECVKDVYFAPTCSTSFIDSSCTCDVGMTLNPTTYQCEGIEKAPVLVSCPVGYYAQNGQCEYHKTVDVVYDFCPLGMMAQSGFCILKEEISTTQTCSAPYTLQGSQCQYIDTKPTGYVIGRDSMSYDGDINTKISSITLGNKSFDAIVSKMSEIAIDNITGCRLVKSEQLAKGIIKKGDISCFVKWTALPEGITGTNDVVSGIFKQSGTQSLEYSLFGFNGNSRTEFEISKGTIDLTVTEPPKPDIEDVTTRLMDQVVTGFEMYNYSEDSQLRFTTVLVKPRTYIQKVTIDDVGTCNVLVGATSCIIYSSVSYTKDLTELQIDSNYKIKANSEIGGWDEPDLIAKDWVIHHDFRSPNIAFTNFNPTLADAPIINTDLGFTVVIAGGDGATGINNFRPELEDSDVWWRPSQVELVFTAKEGTQSVNKVTLDGKEITFDIPNNVSNSKTLTNNSIISEGIASAYPFEMKSLTPGEYSVQVIAKDTFNNETIKTYDNIVVERPIPQIKVMYKGRSIEQLSGAQTINMLDDLTVVVHNGVVGDSTITSIKIDGRDVLITNSETYFKKLTGEGFGLEANTSHILDVEAEDKEGRVTSLSLPFNYLQMTFGINHKPVTVIKKVEDVALSVHRTRGIRCDLYGTKAAAVLASNDYNYACYIEWSVLPAGLTPTVTTFQSKLSGAVQDLGMNTLTYNAYIVNKSGRVGKVGSETITFEAIAPLPLEIELDDKLKLSEGVYSVSINNSLLGRYRGQSSRAHVDVRLSNESGDEKFYKHNQLPFGEIQTFSAYATRLGDSVLWDRIPYTLKAHYRLAPELSAEQKFDLIVTPHPYMQVVMDLDSQNYASTETIQATIKLGLRNNMTGLFEYNEETMGSGWDVYLAFKNGNTYEPITETTEIGANGTGVIALDANIIFERNQAVYAIAKAQSPYPEISIERVSIPRSITVVKGTAVEGKVVSRVVQSRVPANFDIRFDTASYDDFRVLGDIEWQILDPSGNWVTEPSFNDLRYIWIKSTSPETIKVRASVTNKVTLVQTNSDEVTLISYDVPQLKIDGSSQAISGQEIELTALDNGETPQSDAIVEWSLDNGETWAPGEHVYNVVVDESALRVKARMQYANTSADVSAGQWSNAIKYISVTKPKELIVNVFKPSMIEVGTEIELSLQVANQFAGTGIAVLSEWVMPDGSVLPNQLTIKYLVKEEDLDETKRLHLTARAWLEGYKNVTLGESKVVINSFSYAFPSDDKLSLSINNNVKYVPSTGYATLNMPYINAPGVVFTYEWIFDEEAIEKTIGYGKSMNFKVIKAGVHKITLSLSDNRGNFTYIDGFVDAVEPDPLEFDVTKIYSNRYMRAPLMISLYPSVKTSHPYDFMKEYLWTINGVTDEPSSRAIGVFEDLEAGHYDVELEVTSNFGQKGKSLMSFDVKENQAPVCAPVVREQYGIHIVDANCKDSDGTISYYRWVVNSTIFSPYGPQVRFSESDFPSATIVIEAVDDAGAKGIGHASF
jgi:hypothetical protein